MSVQLKIYCPTAGVRHDYIFKLLFNELLGIDYEICSDAMDSHLNYSDEPNNGIRCIPSGLLEASDISPLDVQVDSWENTYCFFRTSIGALPFDIFSAAFYLVSRYEEYLPYLADEHSRFPATESILFKNNLIEEPVVNIWALKLKDILISEFPELYFLPREFQYLSTIDIDQAWKFRNKGVIRNILGTIRDLKEGKWENLKDRWPVLLGMKEDPFYKVFDWHWELEQRYAIEPIFFMLLGDYARLDKNIKHTNRSLQKLIKQLDTDKLVGIHPSYASNESPAQVAKEIERLEEMLNRSITVSRQHFLMHKMPETYRTLVDSGITEDHTMGYSTHLGFRAGIAAPFQWFDLSRNESTALKLIPFCAMDITPLHYRQESPEEAIKTIKELLSSVSNVGGLFVSLWHNESFSETERWKGWSKVYEQMLADVDELGRYTTL